MTILRLARWAAGVCVGVGLFAGARTFAQEDEDEAGGAAAQVKHHKVDTGDETSGSTAATSDADRAAVKEATEVLGQYLDAEKAKKWDKAKALTHPLTLKSIASTRSGLARSATAWRPGIGRRPASI